MKTTTKTILTSCLSILFASVSVTQAHDCGKIKLLTEENLNLNKNWVLKDGVLTTSETPGGILWSKAAYGDFNITLEYKTSEKCNSGLFFRTDPKNPVQGGFEIQIASDGLYNGKHIVGSLYDAKEPTKSMAKPDGVWNTMSLTCKGAQITVVLNGEQINDLNIDDWDTGRKIPTAPKTNSRNPLKTCQEPVTLDCSIMGNLSFIATS